MWRAPKKWLTFFERKAALSDPRPYTTLKLGGGGSAGCLSAAQRRGHSHLWLNKPKGKSGSRRKKTWLMSRFRKPSRCCPLPPPPASPPPFFPSSSPPH